MRTFLISRLVRPLAACIFLSAAARADVTLTGGGLTLTEEAGVIAPGNLAASGTAFAKDVLPNPAAHSIANLNDQTFGNGESWIGNTAGTFAGVSLGASPVTVSSIAFGRDNTGVLTDRTLGLYTLQYTTVANPSASTPDASWTTIGTLNYQSGAGTNFASPSRRHRFVFTPVSATGIRLLVPNGGSASSACIDELEIYHGTVVTTAADELNSPAGANISLREAVRDCPAGGSITFASALSGGTCTLTTALGGEIALNKNLTIDATNLPAGITISGGNTSRIFSVSSSSSPSLTALTLTGGSGAGTAFTGAGGAILNFGSVTLTRCTLNGNSSANTGGAISNLSFGGATTLTANHCTFTANTSANGGAILNGGGSTATLRHCTIAGNTGTSGAGGIRADGTETLIATIVSGNTGSSGSENIGGTAETVTDSLIGGTPLLAPLGNYGGPTRTMALLPGSPARNAAVGSTATTDQRGFPIVGTPDIGAHESQRVFVRAAVTGGAQNGFSWANAFPHLQSALAFAQAGDEIWVAAGTYYPDDGIAPPTDSRTATFALKAAVALYGGFAGTETLLSQRNPAANPTILSGDLTQNDGPNFANNSENAYHVLTAAGSTITATTLLDGFTITAGNANGAFNESTRYESGGGLFCSASASPTLSHCSFQGNSALNNGGGIFNINSASPTLNNCSFQGNRANSGGGILNIIFSSPTLNNCSFQGNSATNGGGINNSGLSVSPTLNNCSFQGNSAANGGGILNNSASPTLNNCSFQGNSATLNGGGIENSSSSSASPTLNNCSFQGNSATNDGGGIYNSGFSVSPTLNNCILWRNKDNSGTETANSSVRNVVGSTPIYSHCLVQGYSKAQLNTSGSSPDTNLEPTNPLFVREVDPNLAPVTTGGDLRLLTGSPALNAGSNALNSTTTDLGGRPRKAGAIDLGAYEWQRVFVRAAVAGGTQDGSSWTNAFPHLQSALAFAQAGDEIWVAAGTYYPDLGTGQTNDALTASFALKASVALYGGFAGTETLLSQRNPAANPTFLSGDLTQNDGPNFANNSDNAYHVLTAAGSTITATTLLDGFTITAGNANGPFNTATRYESGGGLFCSASASPTLSHCSFQGNSAQNNGGGISNISASPTLNHCSFQGNRATSGGGILNISASPTLNNCSFQGNSASDGGGIYNTDFSSPTLNNCSFQGNSATFGGGIYNISFSSPTLNNCSFQGNSATNNGGGIFNRESSPTLNNCSFQGNSATSDGGGIYNRESSSPTLNNCILWRNKDSSGTGTANSSVFNNFSSTPIYSHCLVQGYTKAQLDASGSSPDTNLAPSNPLFVREVDPNLAPTITGGDLRLLTGSPALNAGNNAANPTTTDLAGNPRVQNTTIDLGTYEGAFVTFSHLGYTNPTGDANGNGISNFGDYAAGGSPTAPDDPTLRPTLIGDQLTFSFRDNAADITRQFQKSTTLLAGSWNPLVLTTDYTVTNTTSSGGRTLQTLSLQSTLLNSNPKLFFREQFTPLPPP